MSDESGQLLQCAKCNARLAATDSDKDGFEIPLCNDCYHEVMSAADDGGESA